MVYFYAWGAADNTLVVVALSDCFFKACRDVPHPPRPGVVSFVPRAPGTAWGCELQAFVVACSIIPLV